MMVHRPKVGRRGVLGARSPTSAKAASTLTVTSKICTKTLTPTIITWSTSTTLMGNTTIWIIQNIMMTSLWENGSELFQRKMSMMRSARNTLRSKILGPIMTTWSTIRSFTLQGLVMLLWSMLGSSISLREQIQIAGQTICTNSTQKPSNGIRSSRPLVTATSTTRWTWSRGQWTSEEAQAVATWPWTIRPSR